MTNQAKRTKKFTLMVEINMQALLLAYRCSDTSIGINDLPPLEKIIEFEMGFVSMNGIHVEKVEEIKEKKSISIKWHIEDVQLLAKEKFNKEISDEDALIVLNYLDRKHDACIGVNWSVIEEVIDYLTKENTITLGNL